MTGDALSKKARDCSRIWALALLLYLLCSLLPQSAIQRASAAGREKKWHKDLKSFRKQLPNLHPNPFFKISQDEFNQAVADLDASVASLEDHEIIVELTRIAAMVGDSHTRLDWEQTATSFRTYPLRLYWFSDGLYVTAAAADYSRALGTRLVQIGDRDIGQAYAAVSSLIPHENEQWLKARTPAYLIVPEILNALHILPDMERGHFVFEETSGDRFELDFAPVTRDEPVTLIEWPDSTAVPLAMYQRLPAFNYWFDYLADSRTLYFKYNVCAEMSTPPANVFSQQLASFANTHPVARFVLDLRDNTGGDSSVLFRLLAGLGNRADLNQRGVFFVVVGRRTFSSALLNAISLKQETEAIFVGEATGGKPNHYGNVQSFILSKTGLGIVHSTRFFKLFDDDPPTFAPDINVEISSTDYSVGRDPVIEEILKH